MEAGGKHKNAMLCSAASFMTLSVKWLLRLSPIIAFLPGRRLACGTNTDSNQSVKQHASNHPLLLRLNRVFFGPPSVHVDHKFSAL